MNKVYKVIWNAALGTWCAVSELGKSKKKSTRTVVSAAGSLVLITLSQASFAGFTAGGGTYCTGAGNNPYGAVAIGGNSDAPCAVGAATAIGNAARATADSSTAIGSGAIATARGATSIGNDAQASAAGALAVTTGDGSGSSKGNASGVNSIIIGTSVNASQQEAIAIGAYSSAGVAGGVALGSYSTTTTPAGTVGYDPLTGTTSTQTSTTWRSNKGAVSVGNGTTTTRQITGVAAGSADTDVTNVAQLKQAQTYSTNTANSLRNLVGGNATVASNGTVSTSDIGGTGKANVSDAVASVKASTATAQSAADTAQATANKGLNFRANTGAADKVSLGETVTLADGTNTTATYDASNNIYKYSVVDAPIFAGQVTAKGLNASNAKVTGVAAGTIDGSSTDAVNGSQIKSISDSTASLLGGNATVASDGTVMTSNIGGTGKANVSDAVASVKASTATAQATADKGLNFRANSEAADKVSLGETVTFANGTNTTATYDASSNTYKYSVVDAPIFAGQVTAKGLNASNEKVTGVASGTINSSSTDAVNGSQIKSISDSTASLLGGNATVAENGTVSTSDIGGTGKANVNDAVASVKSSTATAQSAADTAQATADKGLNFRANAGATDKVSLGETVTFADGTNTTATYDADSNTYKYSVVDAPTFAGQVTSYGLNASNQKVTGVAEGAINSSSTDAVNGSQIKSISDSTASLLGGNATVAENGTVSTSDIGGTGKANVNDAVASVKASTATAQATADKGLNFRANSEAADKVSLGETVTFANGTNTTATYDASSNTYKYSVVDAPNFAGQVTSYGLNASNEKVTGVASGTINSSSTDAVNGSQIKSISDSTASLLGGNATVAENGTVSTSDIGGTGKANVNDAVASVKSSTATAQSAADTAQATADKGLNFRANAGATDKVSLGETVTFADGTNTTATYDADSNTYKYSVVDAPTFAGQVTAKGINASNEKVTGVAAGTIDGSSTDAVNGSQVKSISNSTANLLGGNATVNSDGTVSTTNIGGTGLNTVDGAVTSLKDQATKAKTTVTNGLNTEVTKTTNDDGSTNYQVATAKDLVVASVTSGNTLMNNKGVTLDDGSGNSTVITPITTQITNNSSTNTIAGGGSTLHSTDSTKQASYLTEGTLIRDITNGTDKEKAILLSAEGLKVGNAANNNITNLTDSGLRVNSDGPSITTDGIDAANHKVTQVSAGTIDSTSTDAINGSQLRSVSDSTASLLGGNATVAENGTVSTSDIGGTGKANVNDAVASVKSSTATAQSAADEAQATADKGLNFRANAGATDKVSLGETVTFADGTNTTATYDADSNTYKYSVVDAPTFAGQVTSYGLNASNQKVTGVAEGAINSSSTDAVNGSQIKSISDSTASLLGGNATVAENGTVSTSNIGGTGANTVEGAVSNLKNQATKAKTTVTNGLNTEVTKTTNDDGSTNYQVATAKDLTLDSVTSGNTILNKSGLSFVGTDGVATGPSITASGINAGNQVITNVSDGTSNNDAVNVGQLNKVKSRVDDVQGLADSAKTSADNAKTSADNAQTSADNAQTSANNAQASADNAQVSAGNAQTAAGNLTAKVLGGNATYDKDTGAISVSDIGGTGQSTVNDAVASVKKQATEAKTTVTSGLNTEVTKTTNDDGSTNYQVATAKNLVVDSVTAGNTVLDTTGTTVVGKDANGNSTKAVYGASGSNLTGQDSSGNPISANYGLTNSTIKDGAGNSNTSTASSNTLADNKGNSTAQDATGTTVSNGTNTAVYGADKTDYKDKDGKVLTSVGKDGLSITGADGKAGPSITASGVNAGGQAITNVGDAVNGTDAVNKKLLDEVTSAGGEKTSASGTSTASALGGGSTYDPTTGTISSPTYSVNGKDKNNVGDAIAALDQGFTVTSNGNNGGADNKGVIKAGDSLDIGTVDGDKNLTVAKDGNNIKYGLNRNLDVDSVTAGNTVLDTTGTTVVSKDANGNDTKAVYGASGSNLTGQDSSGNPISANYGLTNSTIKDGAGNSNTSTASSNTLADNKGNSTAQDATGTTVSNGTNMAVYGADKTDYKDKDGKVLTSVGKDGLSITGADGKAGPSITASGVNAGGQAITNVGDAVNGTDAVNKKLLDEVTSAGGEKTSASGTSTASALGGGSTYDPTTGTISSPTYSVNGKDKNNVGDAIAALDQGFTVTSNGNNGGADNKGVIKAGDSLDIGTVDGDKNLTVAKDGNNIKYGLNRNLDVDSVTAGNTVLDTTGTTVVGKDANGNSTKAVYGASGSNLTGQDSSGNPISANYGLTNSTIKDGAGNSNTSTASSNTLADNKGNSTAQDATGTTVSNGTNTAVYGADKTDYKDKDDKVLTSVGKDGLSITGADGKAGPSITASGVNAGGQAITNVGDAVNGTDAVNKKLLDEVTSAGGEKTSASGTSTASALGGGSTYDPTTGTISSPTYSVNGKDKNNVGDAIAALDQGFTVTSNGNNGGADNKGVIKAGDSLDIGTVDGDKNLTVAKDGNNIKYGLNRNLDVDSVTAGNTVLDTTGTTVVGKDANGNSTKAVYGASGTNLTGQDSSGNPISANYGLTNSTIKDGAGNSNTTTASSTSVSDPNGNSATTTASGNTVKDSQGNSSSYGATGSSIKDNAGNTTETTASGTNVTDKNGNSNSLTATGNALKDSSGNSTISTASGVTVADALGNSTAVTAEGVKVANGPSLTKTGLDVAGGTITNLKSGEIATGSTDAVTGGQVADVQSQLQKQLGSIGDSAVQYAKNTDGTTNYASIVAGNGKGTTATLGTDSYGNSIVTGGGTTISNVANAVGASDAINKGQLDSAISSNITDVKDGNGNGVSVTGQVVNQNYSGTNPNPDSLFLTYNKAGQTTTDNLTIGETVQKMNKEGVKFAHTNAATEAKDSSAGGENSTALGVNAIAATTAKNSVVIGNDSSVSGQSSIAIGDGAKASGNQSISIGTGNQVTGNNSGAFGDPTVVDGANSYSVGNNNNITQSSNNTFVLGNEVKQTTAGSVVLGTGSGTTNAGNVAGYDAVTNASSTNNQATWKSTTGSVAVGNGTDVTRQITGLAAGSADTDAVNVAQLKSVNGKVNASTTSVANILGGGATVNADGSITNPTYTVNGTTSTTLAGALSALDEAVQKANTGGKDITVNSVVSGNTTVNNSGVAVVDGAGNSSQLAANGLAVTNTTTGNSAQYGADSSIYTAKDGSSTSVSSNGLTIKNKDGSNGASITSSGINAGGQKVTNVANGENATDAVNKGQLDSAVNGVSSSVNQLANSAVQYDTKADGSVNKDKITLGGSNGTTITNVADGAVTAGSKDAVNGGQLANVQNQVTANTNDINSLQNTVSNIGSGKTGIVQQASNDAAVSIGKDSAGTQINVANNAGTSRTISGVANGNVSASSTDAVNGAQVYKVSAATAAALGGGSSVQADGTVSQPTYTVGGTAYNNVGSAVGAIDGKLTGLDGRVGNLENAFNQTSQQMNKLRNDTNAGIAGAMAVGNLPQPTDAGKSMVSAGISGYRGEGAVAVGVSAITDSNKYVWKFGASADTRSNVSGAASVGYQW